MRKPPRARDILAIIEAAYGGEVGEAAWLRSMLDVVEPWVNRGSGALIAPFVQTGDTFRVGHGVVVSEGAVALEAASRTWLKRASEIWDDPTGRAFIRRFYPTAPLVASFSELAGGKPEETARALRLPPIPSEVLGIVAGNPSGHGCVITAFTHQPFGAAGAAFTRAERALWNHLAAHIATGYRLVHQEASVEAVLDPDGKVQHLEEPAMASRGALSAAARNVDRARGALRRTDPERAVALWSGLVDGRWTLVDHFDHDGRRFVVAKRNPPDARAWHTLTDNERAVVHYAAHGHPHKLIAYELGITVPTVANRLASAARKVGAESRLALVTAYRASAGLSGADRKGR
jgi:DNA-binding CsgD family transcriptional regulator